LSRKNRTGVTGVSKTIGKSPYRAYIIIEGREVELGRFEALGGAAKARKEAEDKHFVPMLKNIPSSKKRLPL